MVQLAKTVKDVTIFGVCSKSKHEALKAAGTIDHLLERGTDYSNEVRKCVIKSMIYRSFFFYSVFTRHRILYRLFHVPFVPQDLPGRCGYRSGLPLRRRV